MAIDPSSFHPVNVTDTCAVWNLLSSARLYTVALDANCDFCITSFVRYECLVKPRRALTDTDKDLRSRLIREQSRGRFTTHSCGIRDLQTVQMLESRRRLGKGELSSIAFAIKIGHAVMTDDQRARRLADSCSHRPSQTTPHLHSWLIFTGRLTDADHALVIAQHREMGGSLAPHLQRGYELALQCRYNAARSTPNAPSSLQGPAAQADDDPPQRHTR